MCGIVRFWAPEPGLRGQNALPALMKLAGAIAHRDPNSDGSWYDSKTGIALAQRRLSILNLGPASEQPMVSAPHRYVITYNEENNHLELRAVLRAKEQRPN